MTPDATTDRSPRRGLVLLAMTGSLSMIFIDITVVSVSLPEIGASLGLDQVALNWIVNAYLLALAAGMALGGRLGDLSGKVRALRSASCSSRSQAPCAAWPQTTR